MTAPTSPAAGVTVRSQDAAACAPSSGPVGAVEHADIAGRVDQESVPARRARAIAEVNASGRDAPITLVNLPGRDLDQDELLALASSIAANPESLAPHIAFDDEQRHYVSLHRDTHVDIWLLCWTPQNDTGWHDHDISSGAVAVTQGTLTEHNLAIGTPSIETEIHAGSAFSFGPDHIHRLTGRDAGSVSVHAYSPPLWRMGQYTLGAGGQLRRKSVSYADELRPLDDMA
jgi:quercetin dioxygenase-like cupin family protein